jgi:hypothetical protein
MVLPAAPAALALGLVFETAAHAPEPPSAVPFDCSWIYHPPSGGRERFEGVYYSFIDNGGFVHCRSDGACKDWMGKATWEVAFSDRASAQLRRRSMDHYGVYRLVFEGRRGKLGNRAGCENSWDADLESEDYLQVEKVLSVTRLDGSRRGKAARAAR